MRGRIRTRLRCSSAQGVSARLFRTTLHVRSDKDCSGGGRYDNKHVRRIMCRGYGHACKWNHCRRNTTSTLLCCRRLGLPVRPSRSALLSQGWPQLAEEGGWQDSSRDTRKAQGAHRWSQLCQCLQIMGRHVPSPLLCVLQSLCHLGRRSATWTC